MRLLWDTSSTQTLKQGLLLCESPSTQRHPPKSDRLCLYPSLTLAFCESLLVSLSGEVMWGTSCGPYLSRPVILILPWLLGCQEFQAGRQAGSQAWGSIALGGCPEPGHCGGLGNLKAVLTAGNRILGQRDMGCNGAVRNTFMALEHFWLEQSWIWFCGKLMLYITPASV